MSSVKQTTVNIVAGKLGMGSSDTTLMGELFPGSPIHNGTMTRDSVQAQGNEELLQGVVQNGLGLPTFDRDFTGLDSGVSAPDQDVKTGAGGLPASPWVPNPASPGEGSQDPKDLPKAPDGFGRTPSNTYGTGIGSVTNPATTTKQIAIATLGSYGLGTSEIQ